MNSLKDAREQMKERLKWMMVCRLAGAMFILAIYAAVNALKIMNFPLVPFIGLCLIEGFVNQPYPFIANRVRDLGRLAYFHLVMDLLLISGIIHLLGGIEFSFFNALYPIVIIGSAMILSRDRVFELATLSSLAFAAVTALEHFGVLPHTSVFGLKIYSQFQIGIVLANITFFYFIAFLSTYSSSVIEQKSRELEDQRDCAEGLISMMTDGVMILDKKGNFIKLNEAASGLLGYSNEELLGKSFLEKLCSGQNRARIKEILDSLRYQRTLKDIEIDLLNKDGSSVPLRLSAVDIACSKRNAAGDLIVIHDARPEKEAEKIKSAFLCNISHELNTPLSVIRGFTKTLIEKKETTEDERSEFLRIMDEEAGCLEKIIEDLLDLARMEIGWIKIKKEKGQLAETLREVTRNFQNEAQKKKLLYHVNIPDQMAPVYFDKENISRVVSRLLGNALKYTDHGEISLEAEEDADKVKVSVSDTGKVIEEKELVNIFNLFCDGGGKHEGLRKMNIKLPVIKHIVEAHGGTIWAMSQETQGTRITFTIPKEACRGGSGSEI
jgi:PAS domain S-box-containing protein